MVAQIMPNAQHYIKYKHMTSKYTIYRVSEGDWISRLFSYMVPV